MTEPIIRNYDKKLHKKCIKCRAWKPRAPILDLHGELLQKAGFGKHESSSDGIQSICHTCKNAMNVNARQQNTTARLRHHIATRCSAQLGDLMPEHFAQDLEEHLGYRIKTLIKSLRLKLKKREGGDRKLRDALNEGYHIDHVRPLSMYPVVIDSDPSDIEAFDPYVDWEVFRECWNIENLEAIPAEENLAKGAKYIPSTSSEETERHTSGGDDDENSE